MSSSSEISRRTFLGRMAVAVHVPFALTGCNAAHAQHPARSGRRPASSGDGAAKTLLQPTDFRYLGHYDVQTNGVGSNLAQGLTHRYVDGELRLLSVYGQGVHEISLADQRYGDLITTPRRTWRNIGGFGVAGDYKALWWEEANQRLWSTAATSYTATVVPTQIFTRTLNGDGTIGNLHGPISLEGIAAKRVFGGAQPVPVWFQEQYGVGPYVVGWGGGTSLILQGGNASIGPTMYAIPDPATYANGATIQRGEFRTIMDFATGDIHRGARATIPINYLDGGDPRPNPPTPPTSPPVASGRWLSPRQDGKGWWTQCDAYWNTGQWIDTPTKHGFVAVLSGFGGKVYYMSSDVHCDRMQFELHIFDPLRLGAAAKNQVRPSAVEPAFMTELSLPGLGGHPKGHMTPGMGVGGATYDPVTQRLYLLGLGVDNFSSTNRLYVFQVGV